MRRQKMAKIDFSQTIKTRNGKIMKRDSDDPNSKDFTLRDIVCNSLYSEPLPKANGQPTILSTEDKRKRLRLAVRIDCTPDPIEVVASDIDFIQKTLNIYPTISCAQAAMMLDGETLEDLKKEFQPESDLPPESKPDSQPVPKPDPQPDPN